MTRTLRLSTIALLTLSAASWGIISCSDDGNEASQPSTNAGGKASTGGSASTGEGGSATSTTTAPTSNGGSSQAGTTDPNQGGGGGVTSTDTSTAAVGGSTSTPAGTPPGEICGLTAAGITIEKGAACTDADPQVCYKSCGPTNSGGYKSETCTAGSYVEVSQCIWTLADYKCYAVPATLASLDPTCPVGVTPQSGKPCSTAACISCTNSTTGNYMDTKGGEKPGWCTCVPEKNVWSCGTSGTAWPCPGAAGC